MADSNNLYGDIGFYSIFDGVVTRHITTYDTSASNATVLDFTLNAGVINLVPSDDDKTVNVASLKVYEDANTQFLTTDKNTFDFVKNVRVMGSEYVANDILASGHVIGSTLNVKREFADSNKVGFGLRVTENSNLELFSYDSITDTTRRVMMWTGMQGTTQGNDSNYNYSVFDISSNLMYNVSSADSNTIIYQGGSGGSVWSTIGSNAYYFDGNVGVGTSNANLAYNFTVGGSMYAAGYCNLLVNSTSDTSLNKAPTANALRTTYNKLVALSNDFASQPWAASNFMVGSNNLSEITDAAIARTTLGLGVNDSVTFSNIDTNTLTVNNDAFVTGTMVAGAFESVSDSNLKRDAVSISDGINVINQLNPVTFYWKENNGVVSEDLEGKLDAGFLAQQVENALPLAVSSTLGDVLSVKYDRVIPYLVSAVKELSATVEELKTRLGASA